MTDEIIAYIDHQLETVVYKMVRAEMQDYADKMNDLFDHYSDQLRDYFSEHEQTFHHDD